MAHSSSIQRPIQIEEFIVAIRECSSDELNRIRKEIYNAIHHLERSNRRLEAYVAKLRGEEIRNREELDEDGNFSDDEIDEKDLQVFQESLLENERVLTNHKLRLSALDMEEQHRDSVISTNIPSVRIPGQSLSSKIAIDSDNTAVGSAYPNSIYL